jgi:hypothetical protein
MSGSTQNKTNMTLGKKAANVVGKSGSTTAKVDTSAKKDSELQGNSAIKTESKKAPIKTAAKATVKRTSVTTASTKKTSTSTAKPATNKVAPKKAVAKKVEPQKHIADQVKILSSQRVWPD